MLADLVLVVGEHKHVIVIAQSTLLLSCFPFRQHHNPQPTNTAWTNHDYRTGSSLCVSRIIDSKMNLYNILLCILVAVAQSSAALTNNDTTKSWHQCEEDDDDHKLGTEKNLNGALETTTTMEDFWAFADDAKTAAQYDADKKLQYLEHALPDDLRKIAVQYRHFVKRYPANLAMLVARLPYGKLRSLLAKILAEELGDGKAEDAHIVWYDSFLYSIGVDEEAMQNVLPENDGLLNEIASDCYNMPWSYAVGLVGMGGECLCQIYLTSMYKYLLRNPFIIAEGDKVDHNFWKYHTGPEDAAHRILVRNAINEIIDDEQAKQILDGYKYGKLTR